MCIRRQTDHAKKSFYRAANAIFGKVGRAASEEVVKQLLVSKCVPVLMYGLEVCLYIQLYSHIICSTKYYERR